MTLHLLKLCVGVETVDELGIWQKARRKEGGWDGSKRNCHVTRMGPRRADELLEGGSLYWVIKGIIQARQGLTGIEPLVDGEGVSRCRLILHKDLYLTQPRRHRPFQGWRYLKGEDAPIDIGKWGTKVAKGQLPPHLRAELAELGLL